MYAASIGSTPIIPEMNKKQSIFTAESLSASDPGALKSALEDKINFSSLPTDLSQQAYRLDALEDEIDDFVTINRTLPSDMRDSENPGTMYDISFSGSDIIVDNSLVPNDLLEFPHKDRASLIQGTEDFEIYSAKFYKENSVVLAFFVKTENYAGLNVKLCLQENHRELLLV